MDSLLAKLNSKAAKITKAKTAPLGTSYRLMERLFQADTPLAMARAFEALGIESDVLTHTRQAAQAGIEFRKAYASGDVENALQARVEMKIEGEDATQAAQEIGEKLARLEKFAVALAAARRKGDEKTREKLLAKFRKGENI